jgi:transcriptional regulator with GAF, ATPase, and Fis domain
VANPVAVGVANAQAYRRIEELTARLAAEKLYLEEEIRTEWGMDEVVGGSPSLRGVLQQVEVVAPTDSAVLVTGETGTGKELIARAVHRLSHRKDRTFVKLNCAAIPTGLLESELFGHEKGAFTGAVERRVGRFELADGGTLFLDEVGDIPLELQPKLLRVLQEQFARRTGKAIDRIPTDVMAALERYPWPGNVRELEHLIERAVILSPGPDLRVPLIELPGVTPVLPPPPASPGAPTADKPGTLRESERELIRRTLDECAGVIGGPHGAASRLGLKRTTLLSRMKKLGMERMDVSK